MVVTTLGMREYYDQVYPVILAYLYRGKKDVEQLVGQGVRIRLVKGVYKGTASIACQEKIDVDRNYVDLMKLMLARGNFLAITTQGATFLMKHAALCAITVSEGLFLWILLPGSSPEIAEPQQAIYPIFSSNSVPIPCWVVRRCLKYSYIKTTTPCYQLTGGRSAFCTQNW